MFDISDLVWGTLNYFKDTLASNSGDPRRDTARDFLNAGLRRTFGRDTLKDVNGFTGIILAALDTHQVAAAQKAGLLRDYSKQTVEGNTEMRTAYKVYIPEIEPSPAPKGADDPVLWFYPNIFPSDRVATTTNLSTGDIVKVKYRDMQNLLEPTIVSKEGHVSLAFPSVKTGGLPFKFKTTPKLDYRPPSRKSGQLIGTYKATGQQIGNGELQHASILQHVEGPASYKEGLYLIQDAVSSWLNMKRDFEARFPGRTLTGTGYRDFEKQEYFFDCMNTKKCNQGRKAATPGTSNHGWGSAVDLDRESAGISTASDTDMSALESVWLNKFGKDYGFVFTVGTENWHMDWTPFNDVVEGVRIKGVPKFGQTPEAVYASMTKAASSAA